MLTDWQSAYVAFVREGNVKNCCPSFQMYGSVVCLDAQFLEFILFHFKKYDFILFINEFLYLE